MVVSNINLSAVNRAMTEQRSVSVHEFAKLYPEFTSAWAVHEQIRRDVLPHWKAGRRIYIDLEIFRRFRQAGGSSKAGEWRRICGSPEAA
jgi:hypothetical protein